MYLAVWIDGEHYTEPYIKKCESIRDGFDWFKSCMETDETEVSYEEEGNRIVAEYPYDHGWDNDIMDFSVCEVYEIKERPYALIWWHAYNGVDFAVTEFDDFTEANEAMRSEAVDALIEWNDPEFEGVKPEDVSACVDTGDEWQCWRIIELDKGSQWSPWCGWS